MKVVILLALVSGVFASNEACGENQRHTPCGTTCPLTCDNYNDPPDICVLMCFIGCECKEGYVKTADGQCVLPANCPSTNIGLGQPNVQTCDLPAETGECRALFLRYYFDKITGKCKKFIYGGCEGNANNFPTVEECQNTCGNHTDSISESACDQEKEIGPCMAAFRRFYFNKVSGQCELFFYGGCQGNSNNFNNKEDCEAVCVQ